jgi:hypothetical protein
MSKTSRASRICAISITAAEAAELAQLEHERKCHDRTSGATTWRFIDGSRLTVCGELFWVGSVPSREG